MEAVQPVGDAAGHNTIMGKWTIQQHMSITLDTPYLAASCHNYNDEFKCHEMVHKYIFSSTIKLKSIVYNCCDQYL